MFRAEDYVKVDSLAEAYELCQKRSSLVVGGNVWLKMTGVTKRTIVDLSGLGLDKIEETGDEFRIGCMCTLRQLEVHQGLNQYFGGIFKECTRHIVGVQMRNCATVGGSIFARFGFSDILTCMMALDTYVELYHGGIVPLAEFAKRPVRRDDRDIHKEGRTQGRLCHSEEYGNGFSGDSMLRVPRRQCLVCVSGGQAIQGPSGEGQ